MGSTQHRSIGIGNVRICISELSSSSQLVGIWYASGVFCKKFWNILGNRLSREGSHDIGTSGFTDDSKSSVFNYYYCKAYYRELSDANIPDA